MQHPSTPTQTRRSRGLSPIWSSLGTCARRDRSIRTATSCRRSPTSLLPLRLRLGAAPSASRSSPRRVQPLPRPLQPVRCRARQWHQQQQPQRFPRRLPARRGRPVPWPTIWTIPMTTTRRRRLRRPRPLSRNLPSCVQFRRRSCPAAGGGDCPVVKLRPDNELSIVAGANALSMSADIALSFAIEVSKSDSAASPLVCGAGTGTRPERGEIISAIRPSQV
jgi:hypothetical protein